MSEKYLEKEMGLYVAFLNLEKALDRVDRDALWNIYRIYCMEGKLPEAVKSF